MPILFFIKVCFLPSLFFLSFNLSFAFSQNFSTERVSSERRSLVLLLMKKGSIMELIGRFLKTNGLYLRLPSLLFWRGENIREGLEI